MGLTEASEFIAQIQCGDTIYNRVGACPTCGAPIWATSSQVAGVPPTAYSCECHRKEARPE